MQTTRFTHLSGLALAVLFTLLVGSVGADNSLITRHKLEGTWDVTLRFSCEHPQCPCPGGTPNIPIPGLHLYLEHGRYVDASGGNLFRSSALGSWERRGDHQFEVRYKFFLFNADGSRSGSEEVTNHIHLTGPDTFEAEAIFHLFDANGNETSPEEEGCRLNGTGTRFE